MSFMFEYFFFSNAMCSCAITKIPNIDAIVCNVIFVILRFFLPAACIFSFFFALKLLFSVYIFLMIMILVFSVERGHTNLATVRIAHHLPWQGQLQCMSTQTESCTSLNISPYLVCLKVHNIIMQEEESGLKSGLICRRTRRWILFIVVNFN